MMSPLWKDLCEKKLLTIQQKPSPTIYSHNSFVAHIQFLLHKIKFYLFYQTGPYIKGISLLTSCKKTAGSMTVEAALVLPLFLFFFLNL